MDRLLDSINHESRLNPFGSAALPEMLIASLVNRLEVEEWYRRHPEIDNEQITAPLFILGLPRTGSTLLSNLLALDPLTRSLRSWESERPCPPPTGVNDADDPRIAACQAGLNALHERHPDLGDMLPWGAELPNECHPLMFMEFAFMHYEGFVHVPQYMAWLSSPERNHTHAYQYHKRVLKLLQWRRGPKRWQLKSPGHSLSINGLGAVYPDASFVLTHRDPVKVMASVCSLVGTCRSDFLEDPMLRWLGPTQNDSWATRQERLLQFRQARNGVRFHDVYHADTIADPVGTVSSLYERLGWVFNVRLADSIRAWQEINPRGRHTPDLAHYDLTSEVVRRRFAFYDWRRPGAAN